MMDDLAMPSIQGAANSVFPVTGKKPLKGTAHYLTSGSTWKEIDRRRPLSFLDQQEYSHIPKQCEKQLMSWHQLLLQVRPKWTLKARAMSLQREVTEVPRRFSIPNCHQCIDASRPLERFLTTTVTEQH